MPFLTEAEPPRGVALPVIPGVRRVIAANPGPMTYHGTNTYLIDTPEGLAVLDPGPDRAEHVASILAAAGADKVALILLSHTHIDHVGGLAALRAATGAPVASFRTGAHQDLAPDVALGDGDTVAGLVALHTPGHCSDHLCFAGTFDGVKVLFSADHVMSWSTSIVSPPDGDMAAYFGSLSLLLDRPDAVYLPGHGPRLPAPQELVRELLAHRQAREAAVLRGLAAGPADTGALTDAIYTLPDPRLRPAAERNVLAHLLKLEAEGKARRDGVLWSAV